MALYHHSIVSGGTAFVGVSAAIQSGCVFMIGISFSGTQSDLFSAGYNHNFRMRFRPNNAGRGWTRNVYAASDKVIPIPVVRMRAILPFQKHTAYVWRKLR